MRASLPCLCRASQHLRRRPRHRPQPQPRASERSLKLLDKWPEHAPAGPAVPVRTTSRCHPRRIDRAGLGQRRDARKIRRALLRLVALFPRQPLSLPTEYPACASGGSSPTAAATEGSTSRHRPQCFGGARLGRACAIRRPSKVHTVGIILCPRYGSTSAPRAMSQGNKCPATQAGAFAFLATH